MTLEQLLEPLPEYAKDLKLNMGSVLRQTELTPQQTWGTAVATAMASRNAALIETVIAEAAPHLSEQALFAAKGAAAIMGMNNIFYRFHHLTSNDKYATLPARLRMNAIRSHGIAQEDFELWCIAVSAINGCGKCVDSHERVVREKGMSEEQIMAAIRIAAVVHALAAVFDAENALKSASVAA
jgi:lipoyl-dependent peroxiredoxin subunit D